MPVKENRHQCTSNLKLPSFCKLNYLVTLGEWALRFYGDTKDQFTIKILFCPMCGKNLLEEGTRYCPFDGDKLKQWMRGNNFHRFKCPTCDRDYLYHVGKDWFTFATKEIQEKSEKGLL